MKHICNNKRCSNFGNETTISEKYDGKESYEYWGLKGFQDRFIMVTDCCNSEDFDSIKELDWIDTIFD